jgi:tellurite resistance protein
MNMAWFEAAKTKINRGLILKLIAVAASDGEISNEELAAIAEVGKRVGFDLKDIEKVLNDGEKAAVQEPVTVAEKMSQLEQCVVVMIADGKASQKELQTCTAIAHALGLDPTVSLPAIMNKLGIELRQINQKKEPEPATLPNEGTPFVEISGFGVTVPQGKFQGNGYVSLYHNQVYTLRLSNKTHRNSDAQIHIDGKDMGLFRLFPNTVFEIEHPSDDSGCFTFYELGSSEGAAAGIKANDKLGVVEVTFYPELQRPKAPQPAAASMPVSNKPIPSGTLFMSPGIRSSRARRPHAGSGNNTLYMGGADVGDAARTENSGAPASGEGTLYAGQRGNEGEVLGMSSKSAASDPNTYDNLFVESADDELFDPTGLRAGGTGLSGESKQTYTDVERIEYDIAAAVTISLRLAAVSLNSATPRPLKSNANRVPPPLS